MSEHFPRTIYYLGNKANTAKPIDEACAAAFGESSPVLDLFAGSGAAARQFATRRKVVANDIQAYSQTLCSALLRPQGRNDQAVVSAVKDAITSEAVASFKQQYAHLIALENEVAVSGNSELVRFYCDEIEKIRRFCFKSPSLISYYGGLYFSVEHACELQAMLALVDTFDGPERDYLTAGIVSAASRIAFTVGNQFAQPMRWFDKKGVVKATTVRKFKSKQNLSASNLVLNCLQIFSGLQIYSHENRCLREDAIGAIHQAESEVSFVYADPPYGREHYSRFYHVLETIAQRNFPSVKNMQTMISENRYQSEYSIRSKAINAFQELFKCASSYGLPVALSYADDSGGDRVANRVLSVEKIVETAYPYYKNIQCLLISSRNYSQLNSSISASRHRRNAEFLILAK